MANTKSAQKRIGTNARKHARNQMYRSQVKTAVKKAEQTIFSGTPDQETIRAALSMLDKAAVKGIIHKNNAARRKSRLVKKLGEGAAVAV
ncbi:30S ribosomal protein S20 [Candidatus Oscillochloris fontis]|uniref:30S ribosomal protein S20 n=1 Tax=Candidatus Oscillochloris fontis TaxID=2496868 RepID=UPI00101D6028|nr:30S ribosomal protein S20 [Candidatus Oscillochloris fontis]